MGKSVHIIILLMTLLAISDCFSQGKPSIKISTNRSQILLGEQFEFTIELNIPVRINIAQYPIVPDTIHHLEVVSRGSIDSILMGDIRKYRQTIIMTSFDSGRWVLPILKYQIGKEFLQSNNGYIDVMTVPLKGTEYNDIHEIIEVEKPAFQWWKVVLITTLILIIGYLIALYLRKKGKSHFSQTTNQKMGSFEMAIIQMNKLKEEKLIAKGEMKKFYIILYDILRVYMAAKYTDDMVLRIASSLDKEQASKCIQGIRVCEAAKFAKYGSSPSEADIIWREFYHVLELLNGKKVTK